MVPKESKMSLSQDRGRVCKNGKFNGENDDEAWDYMEFSGLQHFETQNPSRKLLVTQPEACLPRSPPESAPWLRCAEVSRCQIIGVMERRDTMGYWDTYSYRAPTSKDP